VLAVGIAPGIFKAGSPCWNKTYLTHPYAEILTEFNAIIAAMSLDQANSAT
jgi:hypothetical protein